MSTVWYISLMGQIYMYAVFANYLWLNLFEVHFCLGAEQMVFNTTHLENRTDNDTRMFSYTERSHQR